MGCLLVVVAAVAQAPTASQTVPLVPPMPDFAGRSDLILKHLNAVITWYHSVGNQMPTVGLPTDTIFQSSARTFSSQAIQAAFQSAAADANLLAHSSSSTSASSETPQDFVRLAPQIATQIAQVKSQIEAANAQMNSASGKRLQALQDQRTRLAGDLELLTAEDAAVDQLAKFSTTAGAPGNSTLQRSIAQLQRSVPEVASGAATNTAPNGKASSTATNATPTANNGLIGEAGTLFAQATSLHQIDMLLKQTSLVEDLAKELREPLVTGIHKTLSLAAEGAQPPATTANGVGAATPGPTKQQFDALTVRFKRLSAASMPLSQEIIFLDESRVNLTQWRQSLADENRELLRSVLTRVGIIALALGLLSVLSAVWRRVIFRYIHDIRRRRQVLILRRFVVGFLMGVVLILGFVSEFSSLATFAGFITAGLAVGLQTILLSVAAYFFLIGRYGIRVGDRISISGITGDVVDVGLIRLYLLELAGTGSDIFPTGRIVVFPNSVLFQATVPLYKQIPGTDYAWHEVAALIAPGADARLVSQSLLEAVKDVHERYRSEFERQHAESSRRIDLRLEVPSPAAMLQFATAGLESVIRYPIALAHTSAADQQITAKIIQLMENDPHFGAAVSGTPQIRVAIKG